jgi:hypothetical protein
MAAGSQCARYRFYDSAGVPLYFGSAANPKRRWLAHHSAQWWRYVDQARTVVEWFPNRAEAVKAERSAIRNERPRYNLADHPDYIRRTAGPVDLSVLTDRPIVGAAELRNALGVSRQRIQQITGRPDFPPPRWTLAAGRLWVTVHVLVWLAEHRPDVDWDAWFRLHAAGAVLERRRWNGPCVTLLP